MANHADAWILAIDFGTSNTAAAIRSGGRNDILDLLSGSRTMPSGVILDTGNGPGVGNVAVRLRARHPQTYEENPKNLIGLPPKMYDGRPIRAEEFVAEIFREVRRIALDRKAGVEPAKVVLTHPSAWGGVKTQQLRRAAESAGFDRRSIALVEEPIAAAHYFRHESDGQPIPVEGQVLVFDFGGGTLDLALVEHTEDGEFEVKDIEAIENFGGNNLDEALWDWTLAQIEARHPEAIARLRSPQGRREEATLREQVRKAKEELSSRPATEIPVLIGDDYDDEYRPTAEEYETLIRPLVERAVALTRTLLDRNDKSKVVKFYLTGGSSLTPLVARELAYATGITPTRLGDPKTVVVDGALSAVAAVQEQRVYSPMQPSPPFLDLPVNKTDEPPISPSPSSERPEEKIDEAPSPPTPVLPSPSSEGPEEKIDEVPSPPTPVLPTPHVKGNPNFVSVYWAFIGAALLWVSAILLFIALQIIAVGSGSGGTPLIIALLLQAGAMAALSAHHWTRPSKDGRVAAYIYGVAGSLSLVMALSAQNAAGLYIFAHVVFAGCLVFNGVRLRIIARGSLGPHVESLEAPTLWLIVAGALYILSLVSIASGGFLLEWAWPAAIVGLGAGYSISAKKLKRELENNAEIALPNVNDNIDTSQT